MISKPLIRKYVHVVKSAFLLSNAVNSLLWSLHEGSYGYPVINHLLKDLKFVQYPFSHFWNIILTQDIVQKFATIQPLFSIF